MGLVVATQRRIRQIPLDCRGDPKLGEVSSQADPDDVVPDGRSCQTNPLDAVAILSHPSRVSHRIGYLRDRGVSDSRGA